MNRENRCRRILISATGSGRGKTLITSGLLKVLSADYDVHAFKCGPDYIDPMYHRSVLGVPSGNLDPYFCDRELMLTSFLHSAGDLNVIEGAMGLYDGLGTGSECSAYQVADMLDCPIILIVDCAGMGASVIAEIRGFKSMDERGLIKGVLLNRISESYYRRMSAVIEDQCGVKVVGYMPRLKDITLESRHLGLKRPEENNMEDTVQILDSTIRQTVDLEALLTIMDDASPITSGRRMEDYVATDLRGAVIGVARDAAFSFYYRDNIEALRIAGAEIIYFSPIADATLPEGVTALYLGGGYPELHAAELSANRTMLKSIRDFIAFDRPVVAECGGFMYLLHDIEGSEMADVIHDSAKRTQGLVRFGYVTGRYGDYCLRGHEFHHYDVTDPGQDFIMTQASTGNTYRSVYSYRRLLAGFPHFYFLSYPKFLEVFI